MRSIQELLGRAVAWAEDQGDVLAMALVGSHARGSARPDSDVDLVILAEDMQRYLDDAGWTHQFGRVLSLEREDWGLVQSLRVYYEGGPEVEFGLTTAQLAAANPVDDGTRAVANDGLRIVSDPHGLLAALMAAIQSSEGS